MSSNEDAEILAGDAYPVLVVRAMEKPQEPKLSNAPPIPAALRLEKVLEDGAFRHLSGTELAKAFTAMLKGGREDLLARSLHLVTEALESSDFENRRWALASLGLLFDHEYVGLVPTGIFPWLRGCAELALIEEENRALRDAALEVTARLVGIEAVEGDLVGVRGFLARLGKALGPRGPELVKRIQASRSMALPMLGLFEREGQAVFLSKVAPFFEYLGEPGAWTLTQLLAEEENRRRRGQLVQVLKHMGPVGIPALKHNLAMGSWFLLRNALDLVADLEAYEAFEWVVPCLEHPDLRVVRAAVRALWKTGGLRAEPFLAAILPRALPDHQATILQGLVQIKASGSIPLIATLSRKGPEAVRVKAVEALGLIGDPAAIPILGDLLQRRGRIFKFAEPMPIRLASARALGALGSPRGPRILDQVVRNEPGRANREALARAFKSDLQRTVDVCPSPDPAHRP
jgi:HEAT repeat protein